MTLILVHCAHPQALEHAGPGFGRLLTPHDCSRARDTAAAGIPWAADNEAYSRGLDPRRFTAMVDLLRGVDRCLFITSPDLVGDWAGTRALFEQWVGQLAGVPIAYVAQDGQPAEQVPWDRIAALFIGGSTEFKLSAEAERLGREAKARGLWLHMGRVNSRRRYEYARAVGCDSVDGSKFSTWRTTWLPSALRWHRDPIQGRLPL